MLLTLLVTSHCLSSSFFRLGTLTTTITTTNCDKTAFQKREHMDLTPIALKLTFAL